MLSEQTVKRIEEDAEKKFPIPSNVSPKCEFALAIFDRRMAYISAAKKYVIELQERDKEIAETKVLNNAYAAKIERLNKRIEELEQEIQGEEAISRDRALAIETMNERELGVIKNSKIIKELNNIQQLTTERDAYKEALEKFVNDYTDLLWEYSQQISLNEEQVKEWLSKKYSVQSVLQKFNNNER